MDTETDLEQLNKWENVFRESTNELDSKGDAFIEAKHAVEPSPPSALTANIGVSFGPITPDSDREGGDFLIDFTSSPALVSLPPKVTCSDSQCNNDPYSSNFDTPCTPKEGVFDPFAPGPDNFMLAPHFRKYRTESWTNAVRRLEFDASLEFVEHGNHECDADTTSNEEMLFVTVYDTLLEAIVSEQTEGCLAEISPPDIVFEGLKTPTSAPRLNCIAEMCPGAPIKPMKKLINIDPGLCRKLEF